MTKHEETCSDRQHVFISFAFDTPSTIDLESSTKSLKGHSLRSMDIFLRELLSFKKV
jgi:hypothetical protein